jgi:hypothetical protein
MNVKTHHRHMNYFKLNFQFFSLKLVSSKCYLQKSNPTKILESFFLFLEPQPWISPQFLNDCNLFYINVIILM